MDDCIFCKIIKGDIPCAKVYEDDNVFAFLDRGALTKGHTLVIPKGHFENYSKIPTELLGDYAIAIQKVAKAVKKGMSADGFNLCMSHGVASGQSVFHTHMHIIPRNEGDKARNAKFQWTPEDTVKYEEGEVEIIRQKIIDAF